jgi:hypothetical protein
VRPGRNGLFVRKREQQDIMPVEARNRRLARCILASCIVANPELEQHEDRMHQLQEVESIVALRIWILSENEC